MEESETNESPEVNGPIDGQAEVKRGRGRPAGSKNKKTILAEKFGDDEEFRLYQKRARREAFEAAHRKLMASIDKLPATSAPVLWAITHDKSTAEQTPSLTLNQTNINIGGVARTDLLKTFGVTGQNLPSETKVVTIADTNARGHAVAPASEDIIDLAPAKPAPRDAQSPERNA